jgi:hypothetical protein
LFFQAIVFSTLVFVFNFLKPNFFQPYISNNMDCKSDKAEKVEKDEKKVVVDDLKKKKRRPRSSVVWFSWPAWLNASYDELSTELLVCLQAFNRGDFVEFLSRVVTAWIEGTKTPGRRAAFIAKWLPELYFRFIGVANLPLLFDVYQLAMHVATNVDRPKSADAAIDIKLLASVLARCIAARTRILTPKSQTRMLYLPEHSAKPTPPPPLSSSSSPSSSAIGEDANDDRFELRSWPILWQTPPPAASSDGRSSNKLKLVNVEDDEECQTEEMQRVMYETEWTKLLVGSSLVRASGVNRTELFSFAIWLEGLRSRGGIDPTVFLHCLDTMCSTANPSSLFRDVVDPDGRYTQTIRLFMRTLRACVVHDIGHRIYAIFYWMLITRSVDSAAKRTEHHHAANLAHFTDLDAHAPPTVILIQTILNHLHLQLQKPSSSSSSSSTPPPPPPHESAVVVSSAKALPAVTSVMVIKLSGAMDWGHEFVRAWTHKMDVRFNAPHLATLGSSSSSSSSSSSKNKQRKAVDSDLEEMQRHLQSVAELAMQEMNKYFPRDSIAQVPFSMEEVDEGTITPLPQIQWGDLRRASIEDTGRLWVGPFDAAVQHHRKLAGRALFVARKLQEWHLRALVVIPVKKKTTSAAQPATEFWLRYDGMPVLTAAQRAELRRVNNVTQAQLIDHRQIDIVDGSQIHPYRLINPPENTAPRHPYGIVQYFALQIARSILGVAETGLRRDTFILNSSNPALLTVVHTAAFLERSAHSYRASFATIQKIARERRREAERTGNKPNNPEVTVSKWLVRLFGRRGATVIAQRAANTNTNSANTNTKSANARGSVATVKASSATLATSATSATSAAMEDAKRKSREEGEDREKDDQVLLNYLSESDVQAADACAVLFGRPLTQKSGLAVHLRDSVQRPAFMLEARSRLNPFFDALKKEKELPHLRNALAIIHKTMPRALPTDLSFAFHLIDPTQQ